MSMPEIDDKTAAAAFRRLIAHLQHRTDVQNIDLMTTAGFCRNCLASWLEEAAGGTLDKETARHAIYAMPYEAWKSIHQRETTPEQQLRFDESKAKAHDEDVLDDTLDDSFPASDPPSMTAPAHRDA